MSDEQRVELPSYDGAPVVGWRAAQRDNIWDLVESYVAACRETVGMMYQGYGADEMIHEIKVRGMLRKALGFDDAASV